MRSRSIGHLFPTGWPPQSCEKVLLDPVRGEDGAGGVVLASRELLQRLEGGLERIGQLEPEVAADVGHGLDTHAGVEVAVKLDLGKPLPGIHVHPGGHPMPEMGRGQWPPSERSMMWSTAGRFDEPSPAAARQHP